MSYNCCNKVPQAQFFKLFFCLCWVFIAVSAFSSCGATASHCDGFPCCGAWALGSMGFSSCGTQAQYLQLPGSRAQAQKLCSGLVALQHAGSSKTRVSKLCLLYQQAISSHFTTREVLKLITLKHLLEFWRSEVWNGNGWQGWFLLQAPEENPFPCLFQLPYAARIQWLVVLHHSHLCHHCHVTFSVSL